jgi:hypothetical protein
MGVGSSLTNPIDRQAQRKGHSLMTQATERMHVDQDAPDEVAFLVPEEGPSSIENV